MENVLFLPLKRSSASTKHRKDIAYQHIPIADFRVFFKFYGVYFLFKTNTKGYQFEFSAND